VFVCIVLLVVTCSFSCSRNSRCLNDATHTHTHTHRHSHTLSARLSSLVSPSHCVLLLLLNLAPSVTLSLLLTAAAAGRRQIVTNCPREASQGSLLSFSLIDMPRDKCARMRVCVCVSVSVSVCVGGSRGDYKLSDFGFFN